MNVPSRFDSIRAATVVALALALAVAMSCGDDIIQQPSDQNPAPTLVSLSPASAVFGSGSFTLRAHGSDFIAGSVVIWHGAERATEFVSATEIKATILAGDIAPTSPRSDASDARESADSPAAAADDTVQVWVRNPAPGGGTSGALPFVRQQQRPVPTVSGVSPSVAVVLGDEFTLQVGGFGFHAESVVKWDDGELATTYVNYNSLTAVVPSDSLVTPTTATITVSTPPPGGGTSNGVTFEVLTPNPVPTITTLSPSPVTAAGPGFDLTVTGSDFVGGATILWNGTQRSTVFLGDTSVRASIAPADIADGGTAMVSVSNPLPGGGESNALPLSIENPVPGIASLEPGSVASGTPGATVTIEGAGLVPGTVARWNGSDRPTMFLSNTRVRIDLSAADLASPGVGNVSVFNPTPGGGQSADAPLTVYVAVPVAANDLIYDPVSKKLFASVPSAGGGMGNTITAIDASTGAIVSSVFVGSEPNPLARSDDGQYLYVGLDGSSSVRRYVIATETADIEFDVGTDPFFGPLRAEDIEVLPGRPSTVAISTKRVGVSPRHGGVFIYDDGVPRADGTQDHTGSNRIEPSASPARLYGYNNETTEFGFRQLSVSASGVSEGTVQSDLISGFGVDIAHSGGKVFATTGVIIDPENLTQIGSISASGPVVPDAAIDRAFFLLRSSRSVAAFDVTTFLEVGRVEIDAIGSSSRRIVRVDADGVAFIASNSSVVIVRHPVLGP